MSLLDNDPAVLSPRLLPHLMCRLFSIPLFLLFVFSHLLPSLLPPLPLVPSFHPSPLLSVGVSDEGGDRSIRHCGDCECVCVCVCMSSGTGWPPTDVRGIRHVSLSQQQTRMSGRTHPHTCTPTHTHTRLSRLS